jgi:hypothetical protein
MFLVRNFSGSFEFKIASGNYWWNESVGCFQSKIGRDNHDEKVVWMCSKEICREDLDEKLVRMFSIKISQEWSRWKITPACLELKLFKFDTALAYGKRCGVFPQRFQ